MNELAQPLADLGALFGVDEEHHEAAAAGAQELAADRAGVAPGVVDMDPATCSLVRNLDED
jgi:hypothetical protein